MSLIILLTVIAGGVMWLTRGAVDAATGHLGLIREGKVEEAYQSTSPEFQKLVPLAGYREMVELRAVLREMRDIRVPERNVENGVATITATFKDAGGGAYKVPMRLREEAGQWRLIAIDWSEVPVGSPGKGADAPSAPPVQPAQPAQPAPPTQPVQPASPPADPLPAVGPSVGGVIFGSGRDDGGHLIWPGELVSRRAGQISADIQLIHHHAGGRVRVWIQQKGGEARSEPVESNVEGQGSGNLPFNFKLGKEGIDPGDYLLVVQLEKGERFETPFKVK